jgi:NADPH-dependent glutamate synthase beta subunit-like oxidoreductase
MLKTDPGGLILADKKTGKTSARRIYAGGDIVRGPALVVEAVQDGKLAARAIMKALGKE